MEVNIGPNGFIFVKDDLGNRFAVQDIQASLCYSSDQANASRPSCTCAKGFTELSRDECEHKKAARKAYLATKVVDNSSESC